MKSQIHHWADVFIALMIFTNGLLLVHLLRYGRGIEQTAEILAILLFYAWLSGWAKKKF